MTKSKTPESSEMKCLKSLAHRSRARRLKERPRRAPRKFSKPNHDPIPLEVWADLAGYDGWYQVSDHGRIRKVIGTTVKMLTPTKNHFGYLHISLPIASKRKRKSIHSLVLEAFHSSRPEGAITRHLDGNASNNRRHNLAWGTHQENADDRIRHGRSGRGEKHPNSKLTNAQAMDIRARHLAGDRPKAMAKAYGVALGTIEKLVYGESWTHLEGEASSLSDSYGFMPISQNLKHFKSRLEGAAE